MLEPSCPSSHPPRHRDPDWPHASCRAALLLLGLFYVLLDRARSPALARDPSWPRSASCSTWSTASSNWLQPQLLGEPAAVQPGCHQLGAGFIELPPFLPAELAARLPYGLPLPEPLVAPGTPLPSGARLPAAQRLAFASAARPTWWTMRAPGRRHCLCAGRQRLASSCARDDTDAAQLAAPRCFRHAWCLAGEPCRTTAGSAR